MYIYMCVCVCIFNVYIYNNCVCVRTKSYHISYIYIYIYNIYIYISIYTSSMNGFAWREPIHFNWTSPASIQGASQWHCKAGWYRHMPATLLQVLTGSKTHHHPSQGAFFWEDSISLNLPRSAEMLYAIVSACASMPKHWWCSTADLCTLREFWWNLKSIEIIKNSGWSRRGTRNGSWLTRLQTRRFGLLATAKVIHGVSNVAKVLFPLTSLHGPAAVPPLHLQISGQWLRTETKLDVYGHLRTCGLIWSYLIRGKFHSHTLPAFDWKKWETLPRTWRQASRHHKTSQHHEPAIVINSFLRNPQTPGYNRSWVEHKTIQNQGPHQSIRGTFSSRPWNSSFFNIRMDSP